jgi:hypothetical protein
MLHLGENSQLAIIKDFRRPKSVPCQACPRSKSVRVVIGSARIRKNPHTSLPLLCTHNAADIPVALKCPTFVTDQETGSLV